MGTGFAKRKKQAKQMQENFAKMQQQLDNTEVTGTAGNGLVTVTLKGDHSMQGIKIKPECVDPEDVEGLEDLVRAAYQDGLQKLQKESSQGMPNMPAGFPGL